jgi:hypothetical protein
LGEINSFAATPSEIVSGRAIYSSFLNKNKNFNSLYSATNKSNWISSKTFSAQKYSSS